jgi:hypothetical protein
VAAADNMPIKNNFFSSMFFAYYFFWIAVGKTLTGYIFCTYCVMDPQSFAADLIIPTLRFDADLVPDPWDPDADPYAVQWCAFWILVRNNGFFIP